MIVKHTTCGAWTGVIGVSVQHKNQGDVLNGDYVPQLSLAFKSPGSAVMNLCVTNARATLCINKLS